MFIWQSIYVESPSPWAWLCNAGYCLIMINTELHFQFHTVFVHLFPRTFLLSFGRAGKFSVDWHSVWGHWVAWAEQIVLTWDQAGLLGNYRWIHQEEVGGCYMPFWGLLLPGLTPLCPSLCPPSDLVQWRILEKSLFSATLPFFGCCRPTSLFWGSRVVRNATSSSLRCVPKLFVTTVVKLDSW